MGSKKSTVPVQPTTTANMGVFGSTTTGPTGSTWKATDFQNNFVNNAQNQMLSAQNAIFNPELNQARVDEVNRQTMSNFQNNLLMPALEKGLLRGSTAQDIGSVAQKNYANAYQDALDKEQQRQYQLLANALGNYTTIYDIAKGTTGLSNSANQLASNYALQKAQMDAANNNSGLFGTISQGIGMAGSIGQAALPFVLASDRRLKENIKKLDEIDGFNIYEFNYIGSLEKQVGVIAQEMLEKCPECVIEANDGYYKVDYSKLPQVVQEKIKELKQ